MRWFTPKPMLMGCLGPIVLLVLLVAFVAVSRLVIGPIELLLVLIVPALWALSGWILWFGRHR